MIFNSIPFAVFLCALFVVYWFVLQKNMRLQNMLLLAANYFFYGWWNWHFLFLLVAESAFVYGVGIVLNDETNPKKRDIYIKAGVIGVVLVLFIYKYYNFFLTSLDGLLSKLNIHLSAYTLNLILPLGISFYSFRLISYLFDIYYGKSQACKNWLTFFIYVSFFPSLISGPIDRAKLLIPQIEKERTINYTQALEACKQIVWGLFKKIVIADQIALYTDKVFDNFSHYPSSALLLASVCYYLQVYADFSGYTDIAIGVAKLLGFNITKNFNYPLFAQSIVDYWRRWHMSLTTWLTDYVFTPLSLSFRNLGKSGLVLAIIVTFLISGLWHGANWTFVFWGLLHGCYYIPAIIRGKFNKKKKDVGLIPTLPQLLNIVGTFLLVTITFVFFRAATVSSAFVFIRHIFTPSLFKSPSFYRDDAIALVFLMLFVVKEWFDKSNYGYKQIFKAGFSKYFSWAYYSFMVLAIYFFCTQKADFIYFKF